jgi:hypothetical protein
MYKTQASKQASKQILPGISFKTDFIQILLDICEKIFLGDGASP